MSTSTGKVISEETLTARCEWIMRRNERLLLAEGRIDADFYFGRGEGSLLYQYRLGEMAEWMNDGNSKAILFSVFRHAVKDLDYDCMIFASDTRMFQPSELGMKLSKEQLDALIDRGFKKLESLGYGKAAEHITVTGQTPDRNRSLMLSKPYYRDALDRDKVFRIGPELPRSAKYGGGRSAMWGEWNEPGMREAFEKVGQSLKAAGISAGKALNTAVTLVNIAVDEP